MTAGRQYLFVVLVSACLALGGCGDEEPCVETTWYADYDADGYGDVAISETSCKAAAGFVAIATDCDDSNALTHPDAEELCDAADNDCDGLADEGLPSIWYLDADGDLFGDDSEPYSGCDPPPSYVTEGGDCVDSNPAVYPGAPEVCDGLDNDCDFFEDNDAIDQSTWYFDGDSDGYGGTDASVQACDPPADHYGTADDCNDADPDIHPGVDEVCDTVDNDCNGLTDDDDPAVVGSSVFYADSDGDTYGDAAVSVDACFAPPDYVENDLDCDDGIAEVHPAALEVCDEIDNDCDEQIDDDDDSLDETTGTTYHMDGDSDDYGDPETAEMFCAQPDGWVLDDTDCDDTSDSIHPGVTEVCNLVDDDCDDLVDDADDGLDLSTRQLLYTDGDYDGYGNPAEPVLWCSPTLGKVDDDTDCDDTNPLANPGRDEAPYDGVDNDCDELTPDDDLDGDSWLLIDDCDDDDPDVHPDADEVCNGIDDDCNELTDDDDPEVDPAGQIVGWRDGDGDGFGDLDSATLVCEHTALFVDNPDDCDDTDPTFGEAPEWVFDQDGDGWGAGAAMPPDCEPPGDGYVPVQAQEDCDELEATVYPGAAETCGDGIDQDCDDFDLSCHPAIIGEWDVDIAETIFRGESSEDQASRSLARAGDFNADGFADVIIGATGDDEGATNAGAAYLILGPIFGEIGLADADAKLIGDNTNDEAGTSVSGAGDVNADGFDDLLVGAPLHDSGDAEAGVTYLVHGSATGDIPVDPIALSTDADAILTGVSAEDWSGYSVAGAGDVNGDIYSDILIGALLADDEDTDAGVVYLVLGPVAGEFDLADSEAVITGRVADDYAGTTVAGAGDVDGDGLNDLLIGAPGADPSAVDAGAGFLMLGPVSGTVSVAEADTTVIGEAGRDSAGRVAGNGDINDDGFADFLIGAPQESVTSRGAGYLILGGILDAEVLLTEVDVKLTGEAASDQACRSVAIAGDVNQDGFDDIVVGAHLNGEDIPLAGSGYVIFGPVGGSMSLADADSRLRGEAYEDNAGYAVDGAGDVDGDGFDDLLISGHLNDEIADNAGSAYLLYGLRDL